jgi:hypothetical protein
MSDSPKIGRPKVPQQPVVQDDGEGPAKTQAQPPAGQTKKAGGWAKTHTKAPSGNWGAKGAQKHQRSPEPAQARTTAQASATQAARTDEATGPERPHPEGPITQCPFHGAVKRGDPVQLRQVAMETMRDKVFGDDSLQKAEKVAVAALQADPVDAKGETNHLMGLIAFRQEKYGDAAKYLEIAAKRDPSNKDLQDLLKRAKTAAKTGIEKSLGPTAAFNKEALLEAPALQLRMPEGVQPLPEKSLLEKAKLGLENAVSETRGAGAGKARQAAIDYAGKHADKDVTFQFESWDKKDPIRGELEIGALREDLNKNRLKGTYDGEVGFQKAGQVKPEWTERFRTATGAWTTEKPMEGAAGTEIGGSGTSAVDRVNRAEDTSLPSAREVSRVLLTANGPRTEVPFLNNLAIAWIQFENHDWINHGAPQAADGAYEIKLADDDPLRKKYGMDKMEVPKTQTNPLAQPNKMTHLNEVTHWWDGSQIYGSDQATQDRLRTGSDGKFLADGKMRIEGDLLPINSETGVEDSGMTRNWWVGTDLFHTLFVKEHNAICDDLKTKHPDWSSDQLFQTARLINAAEMAKIHTVEWTPAVLPNQKLVNSMNTNWFGAEEMAAHKFGDRKTVRPFEPKDPVAGGLVGGHRDNHGVPYALSEEFAEVYRLHAGMLDHVDVRKIGSNQVVDQVAAEDTRAAGARDMVEQHGMATMLNSFGNQHMTALVNNNYPAFMQDMSVDGVAVTDMGTIDILRARERGVPPYNEFRRKMGLPELKSFEDLGAPPEVVRKLESLYGKGREGLEKMDLLAGTLSEARRPDHFGFGETMFQVFVQMASRRLQADPFYTEKYDADHYTQEGLDRIDHTTLKGLLMKHYPDLAKSGLKGVNNAFEPWGTDAKAAPDEHPLAKLEKY